MKMVDSQDEIRDFKRVFLVATIMFLMGLVCVSVSVFATTSGSGGYFNVTNTNVTYIPVTLFEFEDNITLTDDYLQVGNTTLDYIVANPEYYPLLYTVAYTYNILDNSTVNSYRMKYEDINLSKNISSQTTTNGVAAAWLTNRTYNAYNVNGYQDLFEERWINATDYSVTGGELQFFYFYIWQNASTLIIFKNEDSVQSLNGTDVTLQLISTYYSNNYSTSVGNLTIAIPSPENYTLRYSATGYTERLRYVNIMNNSGMTLTLYLGGNTTATTDVTITVLDQYSQPIENALVQVLRYDFPTNTYIYVDSEYTNFEGEMVTDLTLGTEFYKFYVYYNGELKTSTEPTYIYSTSLTIYISTTDTLAEQFFNENEIGYTLTYTNSSRTFTYQFTDPNEEISGGCLRVDWISASGREAYNYTCTTGAAGVLYASVTNVSGRVYEAKAYVTYADSESFMASLTKEFIGSGAEIFGSLGLIIVILLSVVFAGIGVWNPTVAVILTPLPIIIGSFLNIIAIPVGIAISMEVVALIVSLVMGRRS